MKCAIHPNAESVAYCGQCGRTMCNECKREVRGMLYCETCLASRLQSSLPPMLGTAGPSPALAAVLSVIPGVGAAYNGQVMKGLLQLVIFIALWAVAQRVDAVGWGVAAFWIYVAVDSYQTARRKQLGQPAQEWFGFGEASPKIGVPVGAGLLILVGGLLLLDNLGFHVFRQVEKFWPVILIVIGVLLLQRRVAGAKPTPPPSETPKEGPSNIPGPQGL